MRFNKFVLVPFALIAATACKDPLSVDNLNNPDVSRVFATPRDVEALTASLYQQVHSATFGSNTIYPQMLTASFENASALANFGLGPRSSIPRSPIANQRANPYAFENLNDFNQLQRTARTASNILRRIADTSFTLGSPGADARINAFTRFGYGLALGNVALVYDSASIPYPTDIPDSIAFMLDLVGAKEVMAYAIQQLDSAITIASAPTAATGFPLPVSWLNGNALSQANFIKFVRSYRARFRANIARTPAERTAVDWAAVLADGQAGITADFRISMDPSIGWDVPWLATTLHYRDINWHQMTNYIIGMADTSGAYRGWLATDRDARVQVLIRTPDKRFPAGQTRAAQNAVGQGAPPDTSRRYFRNRTTGDAVGLGWANSQYDHYRWRAFASASRIGPFPVFTRAENDMLAAEALIMLNRVPEAAVLIDRTRVTAGLPALTGELTARGQLVPGATACVPQIPVGPSFSTTVCGDVFEAMKWEKRMESAYAGYGVWFFDSRGWGDLAVGTAYEWPVPYQEMDARRKPFYNLGGIGNRSAAGMSTYGFGSGNK